MEACRQAAQTLVSHLTAQGVTATAQGTTVTIDFDGRQESLDISSSYGPRQLDAADLRSAAPERIRRALEACVRITGISLDTSGHYRNVESRRAGLGANFEDIIMRAKIFSRCPNPSNAEILKWTPVVRRTARQVFGRFRAPLLAFGYEAGDMESLGLVHLTTALHRYRSGDPKKDGAVIGRYVKQRLVEVVRKVQRKGRRCSASADVRSFTELRES